MTRSRLERSDNLERLDRLAESLCVVNGVHTGVCEVCAAAAVLGRKGRGASKRRDVDYSELGRKGGAAGKGKKKPRRNVPEGSVPLGRPPKEK